MIIWKKSCNTLLDQLRKHKIIEHSMIYTIKTIIWSSKAKKPNCVSNNQTAYFLNLEKASFGSYKMILKIW
jgi:hypothetical protein